MTRLSWVLLGASLLLGCDACGSHQTTDSAAASTPTPIPAASAATGATASASPTKLRGKLQPAKELTFKYDDTPAGGLDVVVRIPPRVKGDRFPVLFAFHGRGEAFKGPRRGARGWIDDYWLPKAEARLFAPPLTSKDLLGLSDAAQLEGMNASLASQPYRGVIVVCPYTPDILRGPRNLDAARGFGGWLVKELLPRVHRETPSLKGRDSTGIDGVSLGGRLSVLVGFDQPKTFGVVAGVQAAFDAEEVARVVARAKRAREQAQQTVRLLTSDGDFFLNANKVLSTQLKAAGVANRLDVVPGPHDYKFNRGPGVYEMLLFHDRALRKGKK